MNSEFLEKRIHLTSYRRDDTLLYTGRFLDWDRGENQ